MDLKWCIIVITFCVQLFMVSPYPSNRTKIDSEGKRSNSKVGEQQTRRHKRQLGFWELYYERYLDKENYLPSEVDILSTPRVLRLLINTLRRRGINYDTLGDEVQQYLDAYMKEHDEALSRDYFQEFRPYNEMIAFMKKASYRCKRLCSLFTIGQSYEGRPIMGIKIGTSKHNTDSKKRKIWIDGGTHAREWISHTTALYLADMLITGYTQDRFVRHLVDSYDWYILPCLNPDGYNYTWTDDRFWRKTRHAYPECQCFGTDINRNFGFKWGYSGASSNPCRSNYRGPEPYSDPETRSLVDFIQSAERKGTWLMFITLHAKGQLVLSPWGYTAVKPVGYKQMEIVGKAMTTAISARHGRKYKFGSAAGILYRSSGTSRDWAHGEAGIPYVFTIELRGKSTDSWLISPAEIIPTGQEMWAGLEAAVRAIDGMKQGKKRSSRNDTKP